MLLIEESPFWERLCLLQTLEGGDQMLRKQDELTARHLSLQTKYRAYRMTADIRQHAAEICLEASVARRRSQTIRHTSQQARQRRHTAQVERALGRDHILRNHFYLIVCAWCKRRIRWKRKVTSAPGETSHGICPPCAADLCREIAQRRSTSRRMD